MRSASTYDIPPHVVTAIENATKSYSSISEISIGNMLAIKEKLRENFKKSQAFCTINTDGIINVRYEHTQNLSVQQKIIAATAVFNVVNQAFFSPALEQKNKTPYATFKSSAQNRDEMLKAGVKFYTPDEKIGYHNDVFIKDGTYSIPKLVSLMNLFIGYNDPGNFYYINKVEMPSFEKFFDRGRTETALFKPTPIVYESNLKNQEHAPSGDWKTIPVFWEEKGKKYAFCNGELKDHKNQSLVSDFKDALLTSDRKIYIPQKLQQIMIFRNDLGFHSRDIFEGQFIHSGTTRLFLRSVSKHAIQVPV